LQYFKDRSEDYKKQYATNIKLNDLLNLPLFSDHIELLPFDEVYIDENKNELRLKFNPYYTYKGFPIKFNFMYIYNNYIYYLENELRSARYNLQRMKNHIDKFLQDTFKDYLENQVTERFRNFNIESEQLEVIKSFEEKKLLENIIQLQDDVKPAKKRKI